MKKRWLLFFIFLVIGAGCFYFAIPDRMVIQQSGTITINAKAFARSILNERKWIQWWPEKQERSAGSPSPGLVFNGNSYTIVEKRLNSVLFSINNPKDSLLAELFFIPVKAGIVELEFKAQSISSINPVNRLSSFFRKQNLTRDLKTILKSLQKFYADEDNLYGMHIEKGHVLDSTLISTSIRTKTYPPTATVYHLIEVLKAYALRNGAKQTSLPMLNINTTDSITYLTRVALPVDKKLKDSATISYRWMLGGGDILVTEVKGGPYTINLAFAGIENYVNDFGRTAPAIPFQSLVTDRSKEPDTSKWITKVYWPVM